MRGKKLWSVHKIPALLLIKVVVLPQGGHHRSTYYSWSYLLNVCCYLRVQLCWSCGMVVVLSITGHWMLVFWQVINRETNWQIMLKVHSFWVTQMRITQPMVGWRNWWIHTVQWFIHSFDKQSSKWPWIIDSDMDHPKECTCDVSLTNAFIKTGQEITQIWCCYWASEKRTSATLQSPFSMLYSALIRESTLLCSALLYSALLYSTPLRAAPHRTALCYTMLLYSTVE